MATTISKTVQNSLTHSWQKHQTVFWCVSVPLDCTDPLADYLRMLNQSEQEAYTRYRREQDRRRHLYARLALKTLVNILSPYPWSDISLEYPQDQKPRLNLDLSWDVNITHSGNWIGIACSAHQTVGIDIEHHRNMSNNIAEYILTEEEYARYASLNPSVQNQHLIQSWIAKESIMKYEGLGLSLEPKKINLCWQAEQPSKVCIDGSETAHRIKILALDSEHSVALCSLDPACHHIHVDGLEG